MKKKAWLFFFDDCDSRSQHHGLNIKVILMMNDLNALNNLVIEVLIVDCDLRSRTGDSNG